MKLFQALDTGCRSFVRPWNYWGTSTMTHDEIINEVRQARADILAEYGGDVHKMLRAMQKKQWRRGIPS
jgi:hypothetical protein